MPLPPPKNIQPKKSNNRGQRCCSELGWPNGNKRRFPFVCGASSGGADWTCNDAATWQEAADTCLRVGGWLCRNNEATSAKRGSDCQADDAWVWGPKPCGAGKAGYEQRPSTGGLPRCVMDLSSRAAVRWGDRVRCPHHAACAHTARRILWSIHPHTLTLTHAHTRTCTHTHTHTLEAPWLVCIISLTTSVYHHVGHHVYDLVHSASCVERLNEWTSLASDAAPTPVERSRNTQTGTSFGRVRPFDS